MFVFVEIGLNGKFVSVDMYTVGFESRILG